jgi:hypothetical protein
MEPSAELSFDERKSENPSSDERYSGKGVGSAHRFFLVALFQRMTMRNSTFINW